MEEILSANNLLFGLAIYIANIIQGITGFAGSLLAMPPSIHLQGLATSKVAVNTYGLISSAIIFSKTYKNIDWQEAKRIVFIMGSGLLGGILISKFSSPTILLKVYALFVVAVALKEMFYKGALDFSDKGLIIVLIIAGLFQGMFVSGGPFLIIYAAKKFKDKDQIRGSLCFVWLFMNGSLMLSQIMGGDFNSHSLLITLIGLPGVFLGVATGGYLSKKLSKEKFLKFVYVLLCIAGTSLFI